MKKVFFFFVLICVFFSKNSIAAGFQFSVLDADFPPSDNVKGAKVGLLYSDTSKVTGLDLSLFGLSERDNMTGFDLGLFFGAHKVNNEFKGVSLSLLNWHEGTDTGLNIGLVNYVNEVRGVNFGGFNIINKQSIADLGFINYSESSLLQIGFINMAQNLEGIQIGLVNYAANGIFPVLPLINFKKTF